MELTLEQALQKGIEAHKAGNAQEADRYYTAILKANPKHPDANHNMGILGVGVGKAEAALPFFKAALKANPKIDQYWLSYIDTLIKVDRMAEAKAVLDQAKSNGTKGNGLDKLGAILFEKIHHLHEIQINDILRKAAKLKDNGQFNKAVDLIKNNCNKFSEDPKLLAFLAHCQILNNKLAQADEYLDKAKRVDPNNPWVGWNEARLLLRKKNVSKALDIALKFNEILPDDIV